MTLILLLLPISALLFGFSAGIFFAIGVLLDHVRTVESDCDNHQQAALALSRKLARERQKTEHLTTQVDGLLRFIPEGAHASSVSGETSCLATPELRDIKQVSIP